MGALKNKSEGRAGAEAFLKHNQHQPGWPWVAFTFQGVMDLERQFGREIVLL